MCVYSNRVLRTELLGARKHHPLSDRVYNSCAFVCASPPLLRPPLLRYRSRPRSYPRPRFHLRYCSRFRTYYRPRSDPVILKISPPPSTFPFPPRPCSSSHPVPTLVPVPILRSIIGLHPHSRSRSGSVPTIVHVPVLTPDPVPVSIPASDSDLALDTVRSFPSLRPSHPFGTMHVYRPLFVRVCVSVSVYVYLVAHNRAIRPCHSIIVIIYHSYLSSQGGINATYCENICSHATKRTHPLYIYSFFLSPEYPALFSLLPSYSLYYLGLQLMNRYILVLFFLFLAQVSPVSHITCTILLGFIGHVHLSSTLPTPYPLPSRSHFEFFW